MVSRIISTSGRVNVWPAVIGTAYKKGHIYLYVRLRTTASNCTHQAEETAKNATSTRLQPVAFRYKRGLSY